MQLFDSHAHYNDEKFEQDREEIIRKIYSSGVTKLINAGYSLESSKKAMEIAKDYDWMYVICGISPNDIPENEFLLYKNINELEEWIKENIDKNKIVGIGEIGLDYYWNKENKELQKLAFKKQIELANELNLPIVIHTREAVQDTLSILKTEIPVLKKGVFHCCPLNRELVIEAIKLDFYISFAGPITFKNAKNADEIIQMVPIEKILIETDSPYLSPEPYRGRRNDSRNVCFMAEKIAKVKGLTIDEVANQTYENACRIFGIKE